MTQFCFIRFAHSRQYLHPGSNECVASCGFNYYARGFGVDGRECVPAAKVRSARSLNARQVSYERVVSRSRRAVSNCQSYFFSYYWTGCNRGGCPSGHQEVDRSYCTWKAVYNERCRRWDYNRCTQCNGGFWMASQSECRVCSYCGSNQYRDGSCGGSSNYACYSCGSRTVGGFRGPLVPVITSFIFIFPYLRPVYGLMRIASAQSVSLRSTPQQANTGLPWGQVCRCPNNYSPDLPG